MTQTSNLSTLKPPAASPTPAVIRWSSVSRWARRHARFCSALSVVLCLLFAVNVVRAVGPAGIGVILGPMLAALLVVLGRRRWGLSWSDLGLCPRTWVRGAAIATAIIAGVAVVYAAAAMLPLTRIAFLDTRYQLPVDRALITAFVLIPLGTVLPEEIAFRSVLQGLVTNHRGAAWGLGLSSTLFGAWHILPSLGLSRANPAVEALVGSGAWAQALAVLGAVLVTGIAGLLLGELRRRSGSLLACGGLHWAVNGIGVLIATVLHTTGVS